MIFRRGLNKTQKIVLAAGAAVLVLAITIGGILLAKNKSSRTEQSNPKKEQTESDAEKIPKPDAEDPQSVVVEEERKEEVGAKVDISEVVDDGRTGTVTHGIDVSRYQGTINWQSVAKSGIDFAMVRVGYRELVGGKIIADTNAKYNMQEATKYGVKVGVYFFSTAVSNAEAIEEANWVADYIAKYQITYPVAYNCEGYNISGNRQYGMGMTRRTDTALAFLNRIVERGYSPMFYASKSDMEDEPQWDMDRIPSDYSVWVAQYPALPYPQTQYSTYSGAHAMWQYTNRGTVPGIPTSVDMDIAYFGYADAGRPKDDTAPDQVGADIEALMQFTEVNEQVTAKDQTNLRDKPSQGADSKVMVTLLNGQVATRTGVSSSGWSRVVYNGNTYYAVSSYLTTDLSYKPPQPQPDDGLKTKFAEVNEWVTAKEEVNLRTIPSVTDERSQVVVTIKNGDKVLRTGINTELGWSRVVYNGQVLYCISSYLELAQ